MRSKSFHVVISLLGAAAFSVSAHAQAPGCDDIIWSAEALERSPSIDEHCLEVVERDGAYYAKVHARITTQGTNSTTVRYQDADGAWSDRERTYPPKGFTAHIDGQEVRVHDLPVGQEVNIYVMDEGNFTIPMVEEMVEEVIEEEIIAEEIIEEEIYEEEAAPVMPKTAGQANWLAIAGLLFVLLSAGLYVRRQL